MCSMLVICSETNNCSPSCLRKLTCPFSSRNLYSIELFLNQTLSLSDSFSLNSFWTCYFSKWEEHALSSFDKNSLINSIPWKSRDRWRFNFCVMMQDKRNHLESCTNHHQPKRSQPPSDVKQIRQPWPVWTQFETIQLPGVESNPYMKHLIFRKWWSISLGNGRSFGRIKIYQTPKLENAWLHHRWFFQNLVRNFTGFWSILHAV